MNCKVDIAAIERGLRTNRQAKLAAECQSVSYKRPEKKNTISSKLKSYLL